MTETWYGVFLMYSGVFRCILMYFWCIFGVFGCIVVYFLCFYVFLFKEESRKKERAKTQFCEIRSPFWGPERAPKSLKTRKKRC